jgi:hypothetical protein
MPLCSSCKSFDILKAWAHPPRISILTVQNGAKIGCEFCSLLSQTFGSHIHKVYSPHLRLWIQLALNANDGTPLRGNPRPGVTSRVAWLTLVDKLEFRVPPRNEIAEPIRLLVAADEC